MKKTSLLGVSVKDLESIRESYQKIIKAEEALASREINYNLEESKDFIEANYALEEIDYLLSMKDETSNIVPIKYIVSDKSFYDTKLKGLKKENLRDNMSTLELALNMLAEATTTELTKSEKLITYD